MRHAKRRRGVSDPASPRNAGRMARARARGHEPAAEMTHAGDRRVRRRRDAGVVAAAQRSPTSRARWHGRDARPRGPGCARPPAGARHCTADRGGPTIARRRGVLATGEDGAPRRASDGSRPTAAGAPSRCAVTMPARRRRARAPNADDALRTRTPLLTSAAPRTRTTAQTWRQFRRRRTDREPPSACTSSGVVLHNPGASRSRRTPVHEGSEAAARRRCRRRPSTRSTRERRTS